MIIEVTNYKYRVGSELGINCLQEDGIVDKLNSIIDWDKSKFPPNLDAEPEEKEVPLQEDGETRGCYEAIVMAKAQGLSEDQIENEIIPELEQQTGRSITRTEDGKWWKMMAKVFPENRDYLGNPPELKPGNCFKYDGQLIAIDGDKKTGEKRLVLYRTDSGPMALERIKKEVIDVESKLRQPDPCSIFDLEVKGSNMIPISNCHLFMNGETSLEHLFLPDLETDEIPDDIWILEKLDKNIWRYILKYFPVLKEQLEDNILELVCAPNYEDITFYIDKKGNMVYSFGDLDREEFYMIFPCFWNGLWEYLNSLFMKTDD